MTDQDVKSQIKLNYIYKKPDDYELKYVNGVFGGFNFQGDLLCNFFFEYKGLPKEQGGTIENGNLKMDNPPQTDMIRELKCGIIMTPQQAYAVKEWLDGKLKEFDQKFKSTEEKSC